MTGSELHRLTKQVIFILGGWFVAVLVLLLVFVFARVLCAQGLDTTVIFETIFTSTTLPAASPPVRNVGQSLHVIVIQFPTAVAAVAPIQVRVEASFDNILYLPIMDDIVTIPLLGGRVYSINKTNGVYPYIRVRSLLATPGALPMRINYVGHVYSVLPAIRVGVDRFLL